jgi:hypothetical protein
VDTFLNDLDAWATATVLAAAMVVAWALGWWWGRPLPKEDCEDQPNKFGEGTLALLGLLLAFTFSMSLGKHDQRRQMVVTDSNAIGDFYTCVCLVKQPVRGKLQKVVRRYVEHRLATVTAPRDEAELQRRLVEAEGMHGEMQGLVKQAVDGGTAVVVPLVNTLNALTSSHAARLAAWRDRLPGSIVWLLLVAAVLSMVVLGRHQGTTGERRHGATIGFIVLVSMAVGVTLDLNQPERGLIQVSQEPLQRLLAGMKGPESN